LETAFKSNSYTGYRLTDLGRAVAAHGEPELAETPHNQKSASLITFLRYQKIGHDRVKDLLRACLLAAQQSNLLRVNRVRRE